MEGEASLSDYRFGRRNIHHYFCSTCGVKPFGKAHVPELGGEIVAVNIACLDGLSDHELAELPVTYGDGRNDHWDTAPAETRHL